MEKNLKTSLICIALLCFSFCSFAGNEAKNVIRKPVMETFCHPETGLSFVSRIDAFEKTMVRVNPLPEVGTSISYESEDGALADVYIYRTDEPFPEHAKKTVARILDSPKKCAMIQNVTELPGTEQKENFLSAEFRLMAEGEVLISRLILFRKNDHIIKVRMTYSSDSAQEQESARHFAETLLKQNDQKQNHITTGVEK